MATAKRRKKKGSAGRKRKAAKRATSRKTKARARKPSRKVAKKRAARRGGTRAKRVRRGPIRRTRAASIIATVPPVTEPEIAPPAPPQDDGGPDTPQGKFPDW